VAQRFTAAIRMRSGANGKGTTLQWKEKKQSTGSAGILPAVARASCPRRRLSSIRAGFGKGTILVVPLNPPKSCRALAPSVSAGAKAWRGAVQSGHKFVEKLRYIHRNPVMRGSVARPDDWPRVERTLLFAAFDSCREKTEWVEIESQWTARRREQAGIFRIVRKHPAAQRVRPRGAWTGHPREFKRLRWPGPPAYKPVRFT